MASGRDEERSRREGSDPADDPHAVTAVTASDLDPTGYYRFVNRTVVDKDVLRDRIGVLTEHTRRHIMVSMIKARGLVRHQIQSYERFMDVYLPAIIQENRRIVVDSLASKRRHVLEFGQHAIYKPTHKEANGMTRQVYPYECRMRNLAYTCSVVCDISYTVYDLSTTDPSKIPPAHPNSDLSDLPVCETRMSRETLLCQVPCMLYSKYCNMHGSPFLCNECPYDRAGPFVINGSDKVIISQEKMRTNFPCITPCRQPSKHSHVCEVRSIHEAKMRSTSNMKLYVSNQRPAIAVEMPFIKDTMPLTTAFRLLGVTKCDDMVAMIMSHSFPTPQMDKLRRLAKATIDSDFFDDTVQWAHADLCEAVAKEGTAETVREKRIKYIEHILANEFLPHVGIERTPEVFTKKAIYMAYCVHRTLSVVIGDLPCDEKDHTGNRMLEVTGTLMGTLFRPLFTGLTKAAATYIRREAEKGKAIVVSEAIGQGAKKVTASLKFAMSTGNWGPQRAGSTATGVAQVHNRMTVTSCLSNLRRVATQINKEGKVSKPRQLRSPHWRIKCIAETPEGGACGLILNLALLCHVRVGYDSHDVWKRIVDVCRIVPVLDATQEERSNLLIVMMNGAIMGYSDEWDDLAFRVRELRRIGTIPFDTTIVYRPGVRSLQIRVDGGCYLSPIISLARLHLLPEILGRYRDMPSTMLDELVLAGVVEWVSKDEEETLRVAVSPADLVNPQLNRDGDYSPFTHVEIHPLLIMGTTASLIPFSNHNQAPRNMYQCAMQKQSNAQLSYNGEYRMDSTSQGLCYPQVPLVQTPMEEVLNARKLPMGQNANVAIAVYNGYNQEDGVIMNQSSVNRGAFRYWLKKVIRDEEKSKGTDSTKFEKPDPEKCRNMRIANYDKVSPAGFVEPGTVVEPNDVLICKTMSTDEIYDPDAPRQSGDTGRASKVVKRDNSQVYRSNENMIVDKVIETKSREGSKSLKMSTRVTREPAEGDKMASRHGQKGTIGILYRQEDMPWGNRIVVTPEGRTVVKPFYPDIIINPHAIPSRMTVGKMYEMGTGKVACREGKIGDGTPFGPTTLEDLGDLLVANGCQRSGKEVMYHPWTGEPFEADMFIGPCFYQKLKHVSIDKIHARSTGPKQLLTRQPVEGRARDGGFRFGEMERDCVIAHGASQFLKDRLFEQSDPHEAHLCTNEGCGLLVEPGRPKRHTMNLHSDLPYCRNCRSSEHIRDIKIPYAMKLLADELMALHLVLRFFLDDDTGVLTMRAPGGLEAIAAAEEAEAGTVGKRKRGERDGRDFASEGSLDDALPPSLGSHPLY